jgi:hypothetical protein
MQLMALRLTGSSELKGVLHLQKNASGQSLCFEVIETLIQAEDSSRFQVYEHTSRSSGAVVSVLLILP